MNLDLSKVKKVFFIGIGGIGISAIARMMLLEGKDVSGSDMSEGEIINELKELGVKVIIGQSFELIPKDTELIIYTLAIPHYDPKLFKQIEDSKIQYKSYPEMLGIVTTNKYTIAVAGTHGKTTTTAMIAKILIDAKLDPTVVVGSLLKEYKSNLVVGKSEFFVVEACEYERSFLNIKPKILVITNIEPDHLDYYKDLNDIESAFKELGEQTESYIVCNPTDLATSRVLVHKYKARIVDYTKYLEKIPKLSVPGYHNRMNAACALAVAEILEIKKEQAQKAVVGFKGTWRRLDLKGVTKEGVTVYDDYAHHPTEIKASLQALRELYPHTNDIGEGVYPASAKKITVLFQPHLYSRTKALFKEFTECWGEADKVLLLPIYFARESKDESVSSEKLAEAISLAGQNAQAYPDFKSAEDAVRALNLGKKDVFVTMGAGEAYKVAEQVFGKL